MSKDVVILGAGGASGQRIARRLAARGIPLRLAGRNRASLVPLANELGSEILEADVTRHEPILAGARMLVNTVGPFDLHAAPLVQACLTTGIPYLDIANELSAVTRMLTMAGQAAARGVVLVTGAGFGPAVTESLLLALMAGRAGPPAAVRLAAAPAAAAVSPGVRATVARAAADGAAWYADGTLRREPLGAGAAGILLGGHTWQVLPAPVGDLEAARLASGAPDVIAYFAAPGQRAATGQTSYAYAEVRDHDGSKKACTASLGAGLDVTAGIAAETACRILDDATGTRAGAWTPGALYGPGLVGAACDISVTPTDPDAVWRTAGAAS